ncbi:MAG TPA: hypothetical protein VMW58_07180 [Anaerolineae bacterium]|nr:hypothetical protein [Anaerolineae bacterium]
MKETMIRRVHRVTGLITFSAIVFCLFFQLGKGGPFRDLNPFGVDPYDAVGSFAVQGAFLIGVLTYARALRLLDAPGQATKLRLILRGNALVLFAILATLVADAVAEVVSLLPSSYWGNVLLGGLGLMYLLTLVCAVTLVVVFRRIQTFAPPRDLTPADGIDDLWTLVRVPVRRISAVLPRALVERVEGFTSDGLFSRLQWLSPRTHPWRFACALGLLAGVGLALAQLQEGFPPNLKVGLLVAAIFVAAEVGGTLLGLAVFGGYLGLRPCFSKNK